MPLQLLPAGSVLVDDLNPGFQMFEVDGTVDFFWPTPCGPGSCWADHAYWTYNRSDFEPLPLDQPWNWATWTPQFLQAGYYYVEVFVPAVSATTAGADYEIFHDGQVEHVMVSQVANSGVWVNLGQFYFAADGTEYVYLDDVVPEQAQLGAQVGYDAVLFTPTPLSTSQRYYLRNLGYKYWHCLASRSRELLDRQYHLRFRRLQSPRQGWLRSGDRAHLQRLRCLPR